MVRLLVLYNQPSDPAAFDSCYHRTHVPIANRIPGLRSYLVGAHAPRALAAAADLANFAHTGATLLAYETRSTN